MIRLKKQIKLYEKSEWGQAEQEFDRIFKEGVIEDLSQEAIEKEAASFDMTVKELIRGHVNCAAVKMALGKIPEWGKHNQYRVYDEQFGRKPLANKWDGSDPKGKTIVVYSERNGGAFGDTFIMSFLLRWLKSCGARVIFVPQKPLKKLYSTSETIQKIYVDQVLVRGEELPAHDFSTYLWSLFGEFHKQSALPVESGWLSGKKELPTWVQEKLKPHALEN